MARWNLAWAASVQDTANCTSPSPSALVGPSCAPAWSTVPKPRHKATTVMARWCGVHRMGDPSLCKLEFSSSSLEDCLTSTLCNCPYPCYGAQNAIWGNDQASIQFFVRRIRGHLYYPGRLTPGFDS